MRRLNLMITALLILSASSMPFVSVSAQGGEEPQVRITQVDNSKFPTVTVYVSATNASGEPVGLDPSKIQLSENGQLMTPVDIKGGGAAVSAETIPVTTMLVVDISGSMDKNGKLDAAKEAAKAYVKQMRPEDQAGVIAYDTQVHPVQSITKDVTSLDNAIDGLKPGSDTAMYNALIEAEKVLQNISGRKAIIVLTDGMDNKSQSTAKDVIAGIGQSGLTISAIGFGEVGANGQDGLNESGLKSLAANAGGIYGFVKDSEALKGLYQQQSRALQSEYQITYVSPSPVRDGINRSLTVSVGAGAVATEGKYNPGGVLPEVTNKSWTIFAIILVGLIVLFFLPSLINFGAQALSKIPKMNPVRNRAMGRTPQSAAKGRIKIK